MTVLVAGLGLFLLVWLAHVVVWKIRMPAAGRRTLFLLFFGALVLALCWLALPGRSALRFAALAPSGVGELLFFAVLYGSLSLAYLALYVALEGDSPSLAITRLIDLSEPLGLTPEELKKSVGLDRHVRSRLELLVTDGMARVERGSYRITPKGRRLLGYYAVYDRLAGTHEKTA
jgi:hypothetical protein